MTGIHQFSHTPRSLIRGQPSLHPWPAVVDQLIIEITPGPDTPPILPASGRREVVPVKPRSDAKTSRRFNIHGRRRRPIWTETGG